MKVRWFPSVPACGLAAVSLSLAAAGIRAGEVAAFNTIVGTQTFSPVYQFSGETKLVETAEAIRAMGANVIKFELSKRYARPDGNVTKGDPSIRTLADLARDEPSHRRVLDMPFAHFVLWAHAFSDSHEAWRGGFPPAAQQAEYREIHDLTAYLLRTYSGTGKTFYLGHWEGDGLLRGSVAKEKDAMVTAAAVGGMIDWLNCRQRAIDDAKRETPHSRVNVWHYTEVNHVKLVMDEGRPAMADQVLPKVNADFVSYSCYDTQGDPVLLKRALDFIDAKLPPKPAISGKRVFIGEYGFPAVRHSPAEVDRLSRQVMRAGIEWGCPFVLYWELYNNEVAPDGKQIGFWMIDDKAVKQPIHETHRRFYDWSRDSAAGKGWTDATFRRAAVEFLGE